MECCEEYGRDDLYIYLDECNSTDPVETILVHPECRKKITDKRRPSPQNPVAADEIPSAKRLQSATAPFNWKEDCLLCAKPAMWILVTHTDNMCIGCLLFPCVTIF